MYNYFSLVIILYIIYLIFNNNTIENFGFNIGGALKSLGNKIKDTANKAGSGIKNVANKIGSAILTIIPIPKQSYVPKTYPKASYGIGVGTIPIDIIVRPLKPGIKASKF